MSREDDVGAAGVGEAAKDSRDELEDILKALEAGDSDKHGPNMKIIIGVIAGIVLVSVVLIIIMVNRNLLCLILLVTHNGGGKTNCQRGWCNA
ncbi:MAG: hypothetical protein ACLSEV_07950 [Coprococcus sp.]